VTIRALSWWETGLPGSVLLSGWAVLQLTALTPDETDVHQCSKTPSDSSPTRLWWPEAEGHMSCCGTASQLLSKWQLKSARTEIQKPFTVLKYHLRDGWLYLAFGKGKLLWSWHAALEMPTKDEGEGWLYFCRDPKLRTPKGIKKKNRWYNSLVSWKPLQLAFTVHAGSGSFAHTS